MSNKALIFDMDGVIIDNNHFIRQAWNAFFSKHGRILTDEVFINVVSGRTGAETIRYMFPDQMTPAQVQQYTREIDAGYREIIRQSGALVPVTGLPEFLEEARDAGFRIALATSAPTENVDLVMAKLKLNGFFDQVVDQSMISRSKPDPQIYSLAVNLLDADRSETLVFEDSLSGISSALGARLKVVGVSTSHTRSQLISAGAVAAIDDFSGISLNKIKQLTAGASNT